MRVPILFQSNGHLRTRLRNPCPASKNTLPGKCSGLAGDNPGAPSGEMPRSNHRDDIPTFSGVQLCLPVVNNSSSNLKSHWKVVSWRRLRPGNTRPGATGFSCRYQTTMASPRTSIAKWEPGWTRRRNAKFGKLYETKLFSMKICYVVGTAIKRTHLVTYCYWIPENYDILFQ